MNNSPELQFKLKRAIKLPKRKVAPIIPTSSTISSSAVINPSLVATAKPVTATVRPAAVTTTAKPVATATATATANKKPSIKAAVSAFVNSNEDRDSIYNSNDEEYTDKDTIMERYDEQESEEVDKNRYLTDGDTFIPPTRKGFQKFIVNTFRDSFELEPPPIEIDTEKCKKLMVKPGSGQEVESFLYQQFVREYLKSKAPYRGLLVYHGLGSGKTCSAITAAEALFGSSDKNIIIMTPASLRGNFQSQIAFCGFKHYRYENHWVRLSMTNRTVRDFAKSNMSLPDDYITKVVAREDEILQSLWIPDFEQDQNYSTLTSKEQSAIRDQVNTMLESRIKFINYNGVSVKKLMEYTCADKNIFDNAIIIVDEVHNLTRLIDGQVSKYLYKPKPRADGKPRVVKNPIEPITPFREKLKGCASGSDTSQYNRAILFYRLLSGARNSKMIALSGTPLINSPTEIAVLMNIVNGYIDAVKVSAMTTNEADYAKIRAVVAKHPRLDSVFFKTANTTTDVIITIFPYGYTKKIDEAGNFIGLVEDAKAQANIKTCWGEILPQLSGIRFNPEDYISYERFPVDYDDFKDRFIDDAQLTVKNKITLMNRCAGSISYFKGSTDGVMPETIKDEVVEVPIKGNALRYYSMKRKQEIDEDSKKKGKKAGPDDEEQQASSYRFNSRSACNFAFPKDIPRPYRKRGQKSSIEDQTATVGIIAGEGEVTLDALEEEKKEADSDLYDEKYSEYWGEYDEDMSNTESIDMPDNEAPISKKVEAISAISAISAFDEEEEEEEEYPTDNEDEDEDEDADSIDDADKKMGDSINMAGGATTQKIVQKKDISKVDETKILSKAIEANYEKDLMAALTQVQRERMKYLRLDGPENYNLKDFSPKYAEMIKKINATSGSSLIYSAFKRAEGLGIFGYSLEANGFTKIQIEGSDVDLRFTKATEENLRKGPGHNRYMFFTGDGSLLERKVVISIFNGNFEQLPPKIKGVLLESGYDKTGNHHGEICKVIGITAAGAEGISLKSVRAVHIMEPYWNKVRTEQVKGRAIRICSHADLPIEERNVSIYTYCVVFDPEDLKTKTIDQTLLTIDGGVTTDQFILNLGNKKEQLNEGFLQILRRAAVDCFLNMQQNRLDEKCFAGIIGSTNEPAFHPNIDEDIRISQTLREEGEKTKSLFVAPLAQSVAQAAKTALTSKKPQTQQLPPELKPTASTKEVPVIRVNNNEYWIQPDTSIATEQAFVLYGKRDTSAQYPQGRAVLNPITGKYKIKMYAAETIAPV